MNTLLDLASDPSPLAASRALLTVAARIETSVERKIDRPSASRRSL
jgi:hypothetical protein